MNNLRHKSKNLLRRKNRIRSVVTGTAKRPRLSVFISSHHLSAQLVDDEAQATVLSATTIGSKQATGTMTEKATWLGGEIAARAKKAKITTVVFDRNGKLYHGRVKAVADSARKGGLEF